MQLMRACLTPNKLAWLKQELGEHADALIAAMDEAGSAYLQRLQTLESSGEDNNHAMRFAWFEQKLALTTRLNDKELSELPSFCLDGLKVKLVQPSDMAVVVQDLNSAQVLGFDTETRASFQVGEHHPLSLIQIATDDCCYLFQHALLGDDLAQLKSVLENEAILKVGIGLRSDTHALKRQWNIQLNSRLDLNWALAQLGAGKEMGTRQLAAVLLKRQIEKSKKVTLSNWQQVPLTEAQIRYAAIDAFVAIQCFNALIAKLSVFYDPSAARSLLPQNLAARLAVYLNADKLSAKKD
ncbi:3'-5' exonuclease domain-containing protein 2 [Shewanella sp. A25]|nr:3'-5' exonuclease domain-containing protein 2 [Shewanella shenzhenensis]